MRDSRLAPNFGPSTYRQDIMDTNWSHCHQSSHQARHVQHGERAPAARRIRRKSNMKRPTSKHTRLFPIQTICVGDSDTDTVSRLFRHTQSVLSKQKVPFVHKIHKNWLSDTDIPSKKMASIQARSRLYLDSSQPCHSVVINMCLHFIPIHCTTYLLCITH